MSQRWLVGFAVRRASEARRHLAAVLLASLLVVFVIWLIGRPMASLSASRLPPDHTSSGRGEPGSDLRHAERLTALQMGEVTAT
jgi:hypothetical protein